MTDLTYRGKRVLVTGACGTVGSELVRLLLSSTEYEPDEIVAIDNNETELFFLDQKYVNDDRVRFHFGDVRDWELLIQHLHGIDIVLHAAALKHVVLCERSPFEAVQTNIHGVQNVIKAALECKVDVVVFTSSDKAVNPTSVMGTSKLMGERLITAANMPFRKDGPILVSTRFGNVLGSRGSVVPIFKAQIAAGGPVTLTSPEMTRFIMGAEEATRLVIDSASLARGGEVFITKMPVVRIIDLAHAMIERLAEPAGYDPADIKIEMIGTKPGEKLFEELMIVEETRRAWELEDYFVVLPAFRGMYHEIDYEYGDMVSKDITKPYVSSQEPHLDQNAIGKFLFDRGLLGHGDSANTEPARRYWPGDKEEG